MAILAAKMFIQNKPGGCHPGRPGFRGGIDEEIFSHRLGRIHNVEHAGQQGAGNGQWNCLLKTLSLRG